MSIFLVILMVGAALIAALPGPAMAQDNILLASRTQDEMTIDGLVNEDAWDVAIPANIMAERLSAITVEMRALYDEQYIYIVAKWTDQSYSVTPQQWLYTGGNWSSVPHKEDRMAMLWNTEDAIIGFEQNKQACTAACHNNVFKTQTAEERGDLWQWMAGRTNPSAQVPDVGWMDDLSLMSTGIVPDDYTGSQVWSPNSLYAHDDDGDTVPFSPGDKPKWMEGNPPPNPDPEKFYLFRGFETEITDHGAFDDGATLSGYLLSKPSKGQDRADIVAKGAYDASKGLWTLEMKRKLVTGNEGDVAFDNLLNSYYFGVAIFDNQAGGVDTHFKSQLVTLRFEVPELAVLSVGVSSTSAIIGEQINITPKVKNLGGYSTGLTVGMFVDDMETEPIQTKLYTEMASSFEEEFNFTWITTDVAPGEHSLYIKADSDEIISERDEENNVMTVKVYVFPPIQDFKASDKNPEEGKKIKLTATIDNPSDKEVNVTVVFMEGETLLDTQVHNISAEGTLDATHEWKASKEGTYDFRVYLEGAEEDFVELEVKVKAGTPGPTLLLAALAIALAAGLVASGRGSSRRD